MEIRPLARGDDRSGFESTNPGLERFFREFAGQNRFRHHLGVTYVGAEGDTILGFATVAAGELAADHATAALKKSLPGYPLPVLRLARLATDTAFRGQGIGKALVRYVFRLAFKMRDELGCEGIVVDARGEALDFWTALGFIRLEVVQGGSDARPQPVALFLPIGDIAAALALK